MNLTPPLAAALLMTAASAFASPAPTSTPATGFGLTYPYTDPLGTSPLGTFQTTNMPDDATFNCSSDYNLHIPYASCTKEQVAHRLTYIGPCGSSQACADYFRRITPDPVQLQGQADGEAAAKENAKQAVTKTPAAANYPKPGDPDFIGPMPESFYKEQEQKAVAEARKEIGYNGVKDVVDLGGGNIAKMRDDGTVEMCGRGSCEKPVPAENVKNPKIQEWVTNAEANRNYAGDTGFGVNSAPPGGRGQSNPPPGARGNPPAPNAPDSQAPSPNQDTPYSMGREIASQSSSPKSGGSSSSSGSGSRSDDTSSVASNGDNKVIARTPDQVKEDAARGITFTVNRVVEETVIPGVAASANAAFTDGAKTGRIDVDSTLPADHKAGIQASANSGAPDR